MALAPNPALFIPIEFTDGDGVVHRGDSWARLISVVTRYRLDNKLPAGNPEREIIEQACNRYPDRCQETKNARLNAATDTSNVRILSWLLRVIDSKDALEYVPEGEARRRMAICAACPRQVDWRHKCASCTARADSLYTKLLDGRPATFGRSLLGCGALDEDTRLSTWLSSAPVGDSRLPANCWRR